jgi:hypothetical protein
MRPISGFNSCAARSRSHGCARCAARSFTRIWATWIAESLVEVFGRASRDSGYGEEVAFGLDEDDGFGVGALHRALLARPNVEAAGATLPVMTTR